MFSTFIIIKLQMCRANLHNWKLIMSEFCDCGQPQTTIDTVDSYSNSSGFEWLHLADKE